MANDKLLVIVASLWDLRAQCEEKLRAITTAQRLADQLREHGERSELARRLHAAMIGVIQLDSVAKASAEECLLVIQTMTTADAGSSA